MREVLRVSALVEERAPVIRAADRLDDEHDAVGYFDRRAKCPRALVRPLLEIEGDVLLCVQVDAKVFERALERRHHQVRGENRVPLGRAEKARYIPALRFA